MKNLVIIALCLVASVTGLQAQTIAAAKNANPGAVVTVTGIVTNGAEMGTIRYMQDATAGIAIFSTSFTAHRGDSVTVTGTVSDFNGLIELSPISSSHVVSSGHTTTPQVVTPNQLGTSNDGELVKINNVMFANPGTIIAVNTSYTFTSGGQTGTIFVATGSALVGQQIPLSPCNLYGLCSTHTPIFQVRPRDINDFEVTANLYLTSNLTQSNSTTSAFDVNWTTNANSNTAVKYGKTPALELGTLTTANSVTAHTYSLSGLQSGTPYYVQGISIDGTDTAKSNVQVFSTVSTSSGVIKVYFNHPVDNSVSHGVNAEYIPNVEDTIVRYINSAQSTVDIMSYSMTSTKIVAALNAAYNRGVRVRYVSDSTTSNSALPSLNSNIHVCVGNVGGIMHAKVIIMDANDANNAWIYGGSCNFSNQNMFNDYNNILFIQDQALARAYTLEFNEMWGDTGLTPNNNTKKFGNNKTNNTPHDFTIGGRHVELYFSPSDNTTSHIASSILSANHDIEFAVLTFTRNDLSADMLTAKHNGATVKGMIENINDSGSEYDYLSDNNIDVVAHCKPYDLHHKYVIVDQGAPTSDPLVCTGSHNWSTAAETVNDEDMLIIHDSTIANMYFQEWTATHNAVILPAVAPVAPTISVSIPSNLTVVNLLDGAYDNNCQRISVNITSGPNKGTAVDNHDGTITYSPTGGQTGIDTIYYTVCDNGSPSLCTNDTAYLTLPLVGINNVNALVKSISLYPNPTTGALNVGMYVAENAAATMVVTDLAGKKVINQYIDLLNGANTFSVDVNKLSPGLYFLTVQANGQSVTRKFSKQ